MTNLLLVIGLIALGAYGYWLMSRLDRFFTRVESGHAAPVNHRESLVSAARALVARAQRAMRAARLPQKEQAIPGQGVENLQY